MICHESNLNIKENNENRGVQVQLDLERERILVERAKNEATAFGELYEIYYSRVFGYALKRTASVQVAQDVTSEVFFNALRNIGQFSWRGVPFSAWLYRITSNEIANHFRKGKRSHVSLEEVFNRTDMSDPSADTELIQAEEELAKYKEFLALHDSISKLSLNYQEVIVLRYFEEKQINEIAAILGKPEGTVKSLLHRGLQRLRKLMQ